MNFLLVFFAIPIAIIILSGILETFIHCPWKVAGIFFSIFLVIVFALGGSAELIVLLIIYTIISFITALVVMLICNRRKNCCTSYFREYMPYTANVLDESDSCDEDYSQYRSQRDCRCNRYRF